MAPPCKKTLKRTGIAYSPRAAAARKHRIAPMSDVESYRTRAGKAAAANMLLNLRVSELGQLRAADARSIRDLDTKLRRVESMARTATTAVVELRAKLRDTAISILMSRCCVFRKRSKRLSQSSVISSKFQSPVRADTSANRLILDKGYRYVLAGFSRSFRPMNSAKNLLNATVSGSLNSYPSSRACTRAWIPEVLSCKPAESCTVSNAVV